MASGRLRRSKEIVNPPVIYESSTEVSVGVDVAYLLALRWVDAHVSLLLLLLLLLPHLHLSVVKKAGFERLIINLSRIMRNSELLATLLQPLLLPLAPLFIKLLGAFPALRHDLRVFILCDYRLRSAPLLVNSFLLFLGAALSNVSYFPDLELVVPEVPDVHPYVVMVLVVGVSFLKRLLHFYML